MSVPCSPGESTFTSSFRSPRVVGFEKTFGSLSLTTTCITRHLLSFSFFSFQPDRSLPLNGSTGLGSAAGATGRSAKRGTHSIRRNMGEPSRGECEAGADGEMLCDDERKGERRGLPPPS